MKIVMIDQDSSFDGNSYKNEPLGGTESAFVCLAEAIAGLEHEVIALTKGIASNNINKVKWKPLDTHISTCDLFIANRAPELFIKAPKNSKKILWIHNPGEYLNKLKNLGKLFFKNITVVCSGKYHYSTIPFWLKNRTVQIPLGISEEILNIDQEFSNIPDPISIFSSNPERGLLRLSKLWNKSIASKVEGAKLNLFSGYETYGGRKKDKILNIINSVKKLNSSYIEIHKPIRKEELFKKMKLSRVMLYFGDKGETFCLSVAEAQALGIPAVVMSIGSLPERVINNVTGYVVNNEEDFVKRAISLLKDDKLWIKMSSNAIKMQRNNSWEKIAERYITI